MRISASSIRASVHAMRAVSGMPNPLLEAGVARRGPRLVFRHPGATMDPIAKQFEFDFEAGSTRLTAVDAEKGSAAQRQSQMNALFFEAVRCEEQGKVAEATALYEETLSAGRTCARGDQSGNHSVQPPAISSRGAALPPGHAG